MTPVAVRPDSCCRCRCHSLAVSVAVAVAQLLLLEQARVSAQGACLPVVRSELTAGASIWLSVATDLWRTNLSVSTDSFQRTVRLGHHCTAKLSCLSWRRGDPPGWVEGFWRLGPCSVLSQMADEPASAGTGESPTREVFADGAAGSQVPEVVAKAVSNHLSRGPSASETELATCSIVRTLSHCFCNSGCACHNVVCSDGGWRC